MPADSILYLSSAAFSTQTQTGLAWEKRSHDKQLFLIARLTYHSQFLLHMLMDEILKERENKYYHLQTQHMQCA